MANIQHIVHCMCTVNSLLWPGWNTTLIHHGRHPPMSQTFATNASSPKLQCRLLRLPPMHTSVQGTGGTCCRHPSYNELQASCKKLSAATQVVDNLKKDLVEEQQRRGAAGRAVERTSSRLADLKRALASGSGSEAIASLKQEAAKLRDLVNTSLPKCAPLCMLEPSPPPYLIGFAWLCLKSSSPWSTLIGSITEPS